MGEPEVQPPEPILPPLDDEGGDHKQNTIFFYNFKDNKATKTTSHMLQRGSNDLFWYI